MNDQGNNDSKLHESSKPSLWDLFPKGTMLSMVLVDASIQVSSFLDNSIEEHDAICFLEQFLEVTCKSSGKIRRFAAGTEAGFAISLINDKLEPGIPQALRIDALKDGEEPVSFGPHAVLIDYGKGWKLQTVIDEDGCRKGSKDATMVKQIQEKSPTRAVDSSGNHHHAKKPIKGSSTNTSFPYFGRIMLAFAFIVALGGMLTLFLETLPGLLSFVSSSM